MTDSKIPKIIKKYYRINLEIIIKETDFPTKKCRSAKKITQLKTIIEKQRQRDVRD